ncbi:PD40 domain-containing protein [Candidatus Sumerlaeota bacterium]|nr:PD40 domain-containing protein [Candidatus Sumerlaeota bacterium]
MPNPPGVIQYKRFVFGLLAALVFFSCIAAYSLIGGKPDIKEHASIDHPAKIHPDYSGTVIPPNIAPLNFIVDEEGDEYFVKIHSNQGEPITVFSKDASIEIPASPWHALLSANKGEQLLFDVYARKQGGQWRLFSPIANTIAHEEIDAFLAYRKLHPGCNMTDENAIFQYDLENARESLVLSNRSFDDGQACMNCHNFLHNNPDKMLIHFRNMLAGKKSMLLIEDGKATDIDSRTQFGSAPMGHSAWHPSGKLIVFTVYKIQQLFHTARLESPREGMDTDSNMGYYIFESNTLKSFPGISGEDHFETFPAWSPDGKYLYFSSAKKRWPNNDNALYPEEYNQSKYDLVRISYDIETDTWGELETVLPSAETGRSALLPRISPDGRWLMICMCGYSCWPGFQSDSDLYLIDLEEAQQTGHYDYQPLAQANSAESDYWHCWSSNGRWFVFSSKRESGIFTKPYFSYFDENGVAHKPFVLVQDDPAYYDSLIRVYQLPELIVKPIPITGERLASVLRSTSDVESQAPAAKAPPTSAPWGSSDR